MSLTNRSLTFVPFKVLVITMNKDHLLVPSDVDNDKNVANSKLSHNPTIIIFVRYNLVLEF